MQVENIGRLQTNGRSDQSVVFEFHLTLKQRLFPFVQQKDKNGIADGDLITVTDLVCLHWCSIHQVAITAVEVLHAEGFRISAQHTVATRNRWIGDGQHVGSVATNGKITFGQNENRVLQGPSYGDQSGIHL